MTLDIAVRDTDTLSEVILKIAPSLSTPDAKTGLYLLWKDLEQSTSVRESIQVARYLVWQRVADIQALWENYKATNERYLVCMDILKNAGVDDLEEAA